MNNALGAVEKPPPPPPLLHLSCSQGSFMQPQGHVQLLMNLLVRGMDPQAAIDAPRFCIRDGNTDAAIAIEPWLPCDDEADGDSKGGEVVADELRSMGHDIVVVKGQDRAEMGRAQASRQGVCCCTCVCVSNI